MVPKETFFFTPLAFLSTNSSFHLERKTTLIRVYFYIELDFLQFRPLGSTSNPFDSLLVSLALFSLLQFLLGFFFFFLTLTDVLQSNSTPYLHFI